MLWIIFLWLWWKERRSVEDGIIFSRLNLSCTDIGSHFICTVACYSSWKSIFFRFIITDVFSAISGCNSIMDQNDDWKRLFPFHGTVALYLFSFLHCRNMYMLFLWRDICEYLLDFSACHFQESGFARVAHKFEGQDEQEMSVYKGQVIEILRREGNGWVLAQKCGMCHSSLFFRALLCSVRYP